MKNILLPLLIGCSSHVFCQADSVDIKFAPRLTELGKPAGEKISEKMNKDGGRLVSADGRLELVIPPDAVPRKTTVSIQPVVNTLSPGDANAYQLEPAGTVFQKPLQIIFHYTNKEDAAMPELRGIAWQDEKGQWSRLDGATVDTIARTVTGNITHFSTWMWFDAFSLKPISGRVKVSHKLNLYIWCTGFWDFTGVDEQIPKKIRFSTYVDGVRGGNAVVGTVTAVHDIGLQMLDYTAPANVPDNNPVAVSVEADANFTLNGTKYKRLKLISNVTVFDKAYKITVIGYTKQQSGSCTVSGIDSSSFVLQLNGSRTRLIDIQNMNIQVTIKGCPCKVPEIAQGTSSGSVNIVGATKINVVPASPPQKPYPFITIYFVRTMGVIPGWIAEPCGHSNTVVTPPMALPAVPLVLVFEGKDEEYTLAKEGGDNGFEIKVAPVKEGEDK